MVVNFTKRAANGDKFTAVITKQNDINKMKKQLLLITALGFGVAANAQTLEITGTVMDTVGTSSAIIGSGSTDNTSAWTAGTVGVFEINNGAYYMKVTASNPTGVLLADGVQDSLMVARTTNSQGLTDDGTLSVYVNTGLTGSWSLDLNLSFYSDLALTNAQPLDLTLTSLDIDWGQRYETKDSDFSSNTLYPNSDITSPTASELGYTAFTSGFSSEYGDAKAAVTSSGTGDSFNTRIQHDGFALFMFEMRSPSEIVPEPTSVSLLGLGGLALLLRRQR